MQKYLEFQKGLFVFFLYTAYYLFSFIFQIDNAYHYFSIFVYLQFIYVFLSWRKVSFSLFDSYLLFTIALYVFSLGHAFLDLFDAVLERFSLIDSWGVTKSDYLYTEYLTLSFLLFFHLGALYSVKFDKIYNTNFNLVAGVYSLKVIGLSFALLSSPFYVYDMVQDLKIVLLYGYRGLYDSDNIVYGAAGFYRILSDMFVPSLICLLFYAEAVKKNRLLIYGIAFITVCVPPMFIGSRTNAVIMCGVILLIYSFFNKVYIKYVVLLVVIGYIAVFSLVLIRNSRQASDLVEISEVIENTKENEGNVLTSIISEMGWSMYPIVQTINVKKEKNEHFLYGSSFLWSFSTIVPNLFWKVHPAKENADMSAWITKKLNFNFGIGYSIVAEAYANFGILGFIFMFLLGSFLVRIFRYSVSFNISNDIILSAVSVIILWFVIRIVRNNFLDTIRLFAYYAFPIYLMLRIVYKRRCK